jgi:hypothetical protein
MLQQEGDRTPEMRRDRVRLSVLDPVVEGLLHGVPLEIEDLHQIRAFAKQWVGERNTYDIHRPRSGLFGSRLTKSAADAALKRELATIGGGE